MKKVNTKLKKETSISMKLTAVIIYTIVLVILFYLLNYIYSVPLTETGFFQTKISKIIPMFLIIFFIVLIIFFWIGTLLGIMKGKLNIYKENKWIKKTNPYMYYRELPNNFGIGVASLLIDSTIENEKDIVAVILDLCAKKYLKLQKENDKYTITILKDIDKNLLNNEKYVLSLLKNNNIKNIDYQQWYSYCMQDGIELGLYYQTKIKNKNDGNLKNIVEKRRNKKAKISIAIAIISFLFLIFENNFFHSIFYSLTIFLLSYVIFTILFFIGNIFSIIKEQSKIAKETNYKQILENHLSKTQKGIEELHKLYAFKAFIRDFGRFVERTAEEVVLWDRYLSYAQVFGLTKELMDSGYKELVENASFIIDNIENINMQNIEVKLT